MLEVAGLDAGYGLHPVLHGIGLAVAPGELAVVLGANGAGKTTLINVIAGTVPARAGTVRYRGRDLLRLPAHARAGLGVATVPQGRGLFPDMSVAENLELGAFATRGADQEARLAKVFDLFPRLEERRGQAAETMSGGEQQMLAIGRALMAAPSLLLLDEPSLGLGPRLVVELFRAIRAIADGGVGLLLVEQNARQSLRIADVAYLIEGGRIVGSGTAAAIRQDPRVVAAYLGGSAT